VSERLTYPDAHGARTLITCMECGQAARVDLHGDRLDVRCFVGCEPEQTLAGLDFDRLRAELEGTARVRDNGRAAADKGRDAQEQRAAQAVPVSTYARERVEWLIPGRVPKRAVTVLVGDPGLGKSLLTRSAPPHGEARGCAIVVVAHLNKASGTDAIYRIGGSIGIGGAARSVLLLARDPDDSEGDAGVQRVLAHVKCNVASLAPSLAYRIEPTLVPGDEQIKTARLVEHGESETTGAQLLSRKDDEEAPQRSEAEEFLRTVLEDGPVRTQEVLREAKEAGIAEKTLRRAKDKLGVKAGQLPGDLHRGWAWELRRSGGHLTAEGGHLTVAEPNPHISDRGHLRGGGWPPESVGQMATPEKARRDHLTDEPSHRPPPRPGQVWCNPSSPAHRLRVIAVDGDEARVRVESSNRDAGRELAMPLEAFGSDLRRVA